MFEKKIESTYTDSSAMAAEEEKHRQAAAAVLGADPTMVSVKVTDVTEMVQVPKVVGHKLTTVWAPRTTPDAPKDANKA